MPAVVAMEYRIFIVDPKQIITGQLSNLFGGQVRGAMAPLSVNEPSWTTNCTYFGRLMPVFSTRIWVWSVTRGEHEYRQRLSWSQ
jgi:hypothetical protein